jgi:hypothetical protein
VDIRVRGMTGDDGIDGAGNTLWKKSV